jgi:hypothetical protein
MKELPYFKFSPIEFINADISFCSYEEQGIFIQVASLFWTRNCNSIPLPMLEQRFSNAKTLIENLLKKSILKTDENGIYISFLRQQFYELTEKHELRVSAGSKGGTKKSSNAKAMLKQNSTKALPIKIKNKIKILDEDKEINLNEYFEYNKFYDLQISNSEKEVLENPEQKELFEKYINFVKWLFGKDEENSFVKNNLLSLEKQLTFNDFKKLVNLAKQKNILLMDIFKAMENYKKLEYKTISFTAEKWIKRSK